MATQIITRKLCDFCIVDDTQTDAVTVAVSINGESFEVDACPPHAAPMQALALTLTEIGRKLPARRSGVKPSSAPQGVPLICPDCGKPFTSRASLGSHSRATHDKTLGEILGEPLDHACTVEGCGKAFSSPQGLAVHRSRSHGIKPAA